MKKLLYIFPICIFILTGCSKQNSYQYLATHPKVLEQVLGNCERMPLEKSTSDITCIHAANARQVVSQYLHEVSQSTQGFGQKIMKDIDL